MNRGMLLAILAVVGALIGVGGGVTFAAFSSTTTNPANTVTADRIYPGPRSTTAWKVTDAADSSPADVSDLVAFEDDRYLTTKDWPTSFNANNYIELDLAGPLPAALTADSATFEFDFADDKNGNNDEICAYFEVRRASTGALLATHGSPGSPIGCTARRSHPLPLQTSTPLPEVSTSDIANDLRIRIYASQSRGRPMRLHRATATFTYFGHTWTLDEVRLNDRADGSASSTPWPLAFADGNELLTSSWSTSFASNRYLELRFPPNHVPTGATVSAATFTHRYRPEIAGRTFCYWFEVYSGPTLIGTHGSSGAPLACSSSGSASTVTTDLPEVAQGANANALAVRIYGRSSPTGRSLHDLARLTVNYSLTSGS